MNGFHLYKMFSIILLLLSCKESYTQSEIDSLLNTGLQAFKQQNDTLALRALTTIEPYVKDSSRVHHQIILTIGKLYEQNHQYDRALEYYQRTDLDFLKDFIFYKQVQYRRPEMREELPYFENSAYEPVFLHYTAQENLKKGEYRKSLQDFLKLSGYSLIPIDRDSLTIQIAQLYDKIQNRPAADSIYSHIVTQNPIHPFYRYALDKLILFRGSPIPLTLTEEMKRIESCIRYGQFKRGLSYLASIKRNARRPNHRSFYHYHLGFCHYKLKNFDAARREFRLILKGYPDTPYYNKSLYYLFHIHWKRNDERRMKECVELSRHGINQYRSELIYDMISYYLDADKPAKAETMLKELRKSTPPDSDYLFNTYLKIGIRLMNQSRIKEAKARLLQAQTFASGELNNQQILFFLGLIAQSSGKKDSMWQAVKTAYHLAPGSFYGLSIQEMFPDSFPIAPIPSTISPDSLKQNPIYLRYRFFEEIGFTQEAYYQINYLYQNHPNPTTGYFLAHTFQRQQEYPGQLRIMRRHFRDSLQQYGQTMPHDLLALYYPKPFSPIIKHYTDSFKLQPDIIYSLMLEESWFQPRATSPAGALGLMQLIPATARRIGRKSYPGLQDQDLYRKEINIHLGCHYFSNLMADFDQNQILAIASYNAGENAVKRWVKKYGFNNPYVFIELIPYKETRNYVKKVITNSYYYRKI
ncbi:MAG: transglycosylase SLT domain-containing protein [Candidatus Delongbacteria bacterium]|nr:transglycosylase SLT domain-containing protein [Candidatus Delongbacteria bacterium]